MLLINRIINSRFYKLFPNFIKIKILSRIIYFEKTKFKRLPLNNYQKSLNLEDIFNYQIKLDQKNLLKLRYTSPDLPKIIKKCLKKKNIKFLDYGAGEIKNYLFLKNKLDKKLQYFYKDKKYLENFFMKQQVLKKDKNFNIYKPGSDIDIIYFGSSLQYLENLNNILQSIISKNTKTIIVAGILSYEEIPFNKFICVQRNMVNKKFYLYFYNIKYLINIFCKLGFKVKKIKTNKSDKYLNFKNFNIGKFRYTDIVFDK